MNLILLAIVSVAITAGCPDQKKDVALWRKVVDAGAPTATQPSGPMPLMTALALANANNQQLALSGEDYLQALIQKDRAVSLFLPIVSLQPTYFRMEPLPTVPGLPFSISTFAPSHAFDVPINAGMNVFNGFRDVAALREASANADARKALLEDLQATILVETAQVYYQILSTEAQVRVFDDTIRVRDEQVALIENQLRAGIARKVDLDQARAQASQARVFRLQAQARVVNGRATLAQLLSVARVDNVLVDDLTVPDVAAEPALEAIALENRKDLAAAIAGVQAAKQEVERAIGEYYPSVTIDFNYYFERQSFPQESKWNALLAANIPIFRGGQIEADVRTAWSQLRQALLRRQQVMNQIARDVQVAYVDLLTAGEAVQQLNVQVQASRSGLSTARESYKQGTMTGVEVIIAQNQVLNADLQLVNQIYQKKLAYLTLLRVTGQMTFEQPALKRAVPATAQASQPTVVTSREAQASGAVAVDREGDHGFHRLTADSTD